ncbi:hypothetical protein Barba19A_gp143 [Rheinheimera phage vB_RspM_Barba19A]|uniref:Uncharacterized protein n=6 Tax=Barbavirus TaxID=2733095 RepID=A0A4P8N4F9_9CAUD|nr:hypothetical protein HOV44_gp145 [Rheinheimera phage Barba5S]YP_009823156.1 hypothetical protein HOV47_gp143 [Rheinheimera phage vB_RspM_Barba19A]QCQ61152.1 hypothetical protein Barba15A_gp143 [Rheinheimera phage vB_RspM_Barba15A]QCQ64454.1 hypothetical protein Barba29S_gp139 [Rheinheimera phage vB_RspM_Barba29S]QCQ64590.1 hypothetical protein Barba30A_gp136 [Rheinheimera phage vB_RspM_Barba30A]QCQ64733.1 hypothetical protein Barba31A_gp143 [Rheinheimera phage vB_RspM_Barba31A]QCQ59223.1 h
MAEQTVVEVYRTQEDKANYDFVSCVTISYFDDIAFIQGLSGTFTTKCYKEIVDYLERKGMKQIQYFRKGRLKVIWLDSKL